MSTTTDNAEIVAPTGATSPHAPDLLRPPLRWTEMDLEERIGFRGGRHTRVNTTLSFLLACLGTVLFYGGLLLVKNSYFYAMFTERGPTPYFIVLLSFWALAVLAFKWHKLGVQQRALRHDVTPADADFVLSAATVDQVTARILALADDPRQFVLLNRLLIALSNLKNLGRISDIEDILRAQAERDESAMETSYSLVEAFIWAIPVLGFIGTVLGLSEAIGGFGAVLGSADEISQISQALRSVTAGLKTAFETTLEALVAALAIQLFRVMVKKSEEEFLDECGDYGLRQIVNRLRIQPFETAREG